MSDETTMPDRRAPLTKDERDGLRKQLEHSIYAHADKILRLLDQVEALQRDLLVFTDTAPSQLPGGPVGPFGNGGSCCPRFTQNAATDSPP